MTEYKSISLPKPLYDKIFNLANKKKVANWQIIHEALNFYELLEKRPYQKKDLPRLDKASWYIWKVAKAIALIEEYPDESNVGRVLQVLDQVNERLFNNQNENIEILKKLIERYVKEKSKELKIEISTTVKMLIADIIVTLLFESS